MKLTDKQFDELQDILENITPDSICAGYVGKSLVGVEFCMGDGNVCEVFLYFRNGENDDKLSALVIGTAEDENFRISPLMFGAAEIDLTEQKQGDAPP